MEKKKLKSTNLSLSNTLSIIILKDIAYPFLYIFEKYLLNSVNNAMNIVALSK